MNQYCKTGSTETLENALAKFITVNNLALPVTEDRIVAVLGITGA